MVSYIQITKPDKICRIGIFGFLRSIEKNLSCMVRVHLFRYLRVNWELGARQIRYQQQQLRPSWLLKNSTIERRAACRESVARPRGLQCRIVLPCYSAALASIHDLVPSQIVFYNSNVEFWFYCGLVAWGRHAACPRDQPPSVSSSLVVGATRCCSSLRNRNTCIALKHLLLVGPRPTRFYFFGRASPPTAKLR